MGDSKAVESDQVEGSAALGRAPAVESKGTNAFGGGNRHSLYMPMSEDEQEVIERLATAGDLRVHILGWGVVNQPRVVFGDLRVSLRFKLVFDRPETPQPNFYFDMELRTGTGLLLYKERMKTLYNGNPIEIVAGMELELAWDIALAYMDPKVVKALKPGATGLTSRVLDRDTKDATVTGNMRMGSEKADKAHLMRRFEARNKRDSDRQRAKATKMAGREHEDALRKITDK